MMPGGAPNLNANEDLTATGTFGDFRTGAINFGGQSSLNYLVLAAGIVAVIYLLRK
ncbi:MAG: hypothetical protein ACYCX5_12550 [Coriobacteriia bacterium]